MQRFILDELAGSSYSQAAGQEPLGIWGKLTDNLAWAWENRGSPDDDFDPSRSSAETVNRAIRSLVAAGRVAVFMDSDDGKHFYRRVVLVPNNPV